ncbi:MAG: asparagine synthetase B family protein, partial [Planctomycetia bacterium]
DTETLLAAVDAWGLKTAVKRCIGMFAFALWDSLEQSLHLVRDRLGEKPLYYGVFKNGFAFASEPKAFRRHPDWTGTLDRLSLARYMKLGCVPAPHSIFEDVRKLPPGAMLTLRRDEPFDLTGLQPQRFWSAAMTATAPTYYGRPAEAVQRFEALLGDAVGRQLTADVPVGAFLSGGVDSSLIVALARERADHPLQTFTVGFEEPRFNEAPYAAAVAEHLQTEHTELMVGEAQARSILPELSTMFDEPLADPSAIPMALVARLARRSVTVGLSGDGGDESFGGYGRYLRVEKEWSRLRRLPWMVRRLVAGASTRMELYARHLRIWPDAERLVKGLDAAARADAPWVARPPAPL